MGDRICRSSGVGIHWAALFYKYVAATRLGAFALGFGAKPGNGYFLAPPPGGSYWDLTRPDAVWYLPRPPFSAPYCSLFTIHHLLSLHESYSSCRSRRAGGAHSRRPSRSRSQTK